MPGDKHKTNIITQLFVEILAIYYFGNLRACPDMLDNTQQK